MDRRGSKLSAQLTAQLLGIPGDITHVEFNHKTNTIDVIFVGNGSFQCAEGQEVCIRDPATWREWDEKHEVKQVEELEKELIRQWEKDQ